jgi:hypothetical protein
MEWSASRPSSFTSTEINSGTHWIAGVVGPRGQFERRGEYEVAGHFSLAPDGNRFRYYSPI